ncbi:MAG: biotin transporter BioY [Dehalococcoides mccartyi]|uniref:biotin transporter BioY n=1 Tax=Dehalococcoides TaxID=61434 RepID=UPI0004E09834|nr:biotin transporter BioY [Dehalococcoides mccartyi]AII59741.1 biotin carboxyl carrier protein [Dehalococcoides mccartyi CG4]MBF4482205.1 biotin transporter BioY [Dehalococcoides mccartyi]MBJ7531783.1 biotin transporter BioY [Dehalococcoides mccartyi]MDP4279191.1 biotin transporter BioY [Dehalococcoides mccartyi]
MQMTGTLSQFRYDVFKRRSALNIWAKIGLTLAAAGLIALSAQIKLPLPWTPIPVTLHTFAILLSAVLLGRWWGGAAVAIYAAAGWAGMPVFNGWSAGVTATAGYLVGFVCLSLFLGYFADRYIRARSFTTMFGLMLFANFALVYIPGLFWLNYWLSAVVGQPVSFTALLSMGLVPFIAGDIIKIGVAALIVKGVTPKKAFGNELDAHKMTGWNIF